jgi:hypothetical protein
MNQVRLGVDGDAGGAKEGLMRAADRCDRDRNFGPACR